MISQARLRRKTHASPNGIASGLKRKREEDEELVNARVVKRQYEYIQEGGGEAMVVVNTRDFHRKPSSQPSGPRTPQRRNTIAMGDLRSPPLVRDREIESEETRISTRGTKPPPPMRTTSLKTVTAGVVANELLGSSDPAEIPIEGTMVQRWSSEQNPDGGILNGPERPSSSNAVLESWYTSNNLSPDQELAYEHPARISNGPRKASSSLSPNTTNGFVTPVDNNTESKMLAGKMQNQGLSASLAPGLRAALVSRLESCLIDLGSPADNMTLAR